MRIAILSGKGGTGKTTVATAMAAALSESQYVDCDVEEPNGAIFLRPEITRSDPVLLPVPEVDPLKCDGCGKCAKACQYGAIAVVKGKVLLFHEICHHCGVCSLLCPCSAIQEIQRSIGVIEANEAETFLQGRLNIGEPSGVPIIRELKKRLRQDGPVILDAPPGAACAVTQVVEGCDYSILVTEPTPFGLHDLQIVVRLVGRMGIPYGVVLNKATDDQRIVQQFCVEKRIELLLEIPFSMEIAKAYSRGILPLQSFKWRESFRELYTRIEGRIGCEKNRLCQR